MEERETTRRQASSDRSDLWGVYGEMTYVRYCYGCIGDKDQHLYTLLGSDGEPMECPQKGSWRITL